MNLSLIVIWRGAYTRRVAKLCQASKGIGQVDRRDRIAIPRDCEPIGHAGDIIGDVAAPLGIVGGRPGAMLWPVVWWGFDVATLWACFEAFGDAPAIGTLILCYFLGAMGNLLPIPGGVGGVEGGMIGAFAAFGVDAGLAVVAVLVFRAFTFWLPLLPGVIAFFRLRAQVEEWRRERGATIQSKA